MFQLEKGKYSNQKKKNIPIRKRNLEMAKEEEEQDKNKLLRPLEQA